MAAFMFAYGMGKSVATGTTTHTSEPMDTPTDGLEPPYFTFVEQIRPPGSTSIIDRAFPGCIVDNFTISVGSGPGRQNSRYTVAFKGSGKIIDPSVLVIPDLATPHYLPSASMTLIINGTNYVTSKNIISLDWQYNNNPLLELGYFPGSGFQDPSNPDSGQIRGRIEVGVRTSTLRMVARFVHGSTELTALKARTEGTFAWTQTGAVGHSLAVNAARVQFKDVRISEASGIVTIELEVAFLFPVGGPLLTAAVTNTIDLVGNET